MTKLEEAARKIALTRVRAKEKRRKRREVASVPKPIYSGPDMSRLGLFLVARSSSSVYIFNNGNWNAEDPLKPKAGGSCRFELENASVAQAEAWIVAKLGAVPCADAKRLVQIGRTLGPKDRLYDWGSFDYTDVCVRVIRSEMWSEVEKLDLEGSRTLKRLIKLGKKLLKSEKLRSEMEAVDLTNKPVLSKVIRALLPLTPKPVPVAVPEPVKVRIKKTLRRKKRRKLGPALLARTKKAA